MFEELNNTCSGVCVVIGNGPSLRDFPLDELEKYPTFGSNRIYLKYVPTYYACVNPLVLENFRSEILAIPAVKFLRIDERIEGVYNLVSMSTPLFSYNPSSYVFEGYTVTFVLLQLAFFMGFEKVKLVGVDHRFIFQGMPNEARLQVEDDPNHFSPDYFKGVLWNNPDLERSALAYKMARTAFEDVGRTIVNCTPGSALDVFEFEEWQ